MRCYLTIILAVFCCLSALGSINEGPGGAASSNPKAMNDGVEESQPSGDNLPPDLVALRDKMAEIDRQGKAEVQARADAFNWWNPFSKIPDRDNPFRRGKSLTTAGSLKEFPWKLALGWMAVAFVVTAFGSKGSSRSGRASTKKYK